MPKALPFVLIVAVLAASALRPAARAASGVTFHLSIGALLRVEIGVGA